MSQEKGAPLTSVKVSAHSIGMNFSEIFKDISAGLLVTDADFNVIWAKSPKD